MKQFVQLLILVGCGTACFSQAADSKADSLRQAGNLEKAIEAYTNEFRKFPGNQKNTYDLACAYALAFQKDSAYHYLDIALKNDYSLWALADTDLYALTDDLRWAAVENRQLAKFQEKEGTLEQPEYARELLRILVKDQALDYYIKQARKYYMEKGAIPQWYYPIAAYKKQIGETSFNDLQQLIARYGWPKYSTVGKLAADAHLLVINHQEADSVRKKYLPQIKRSCLEQEGSCVEYAKIQDRILVNDNKPQRYGMQFRYNAQRQLEPFPIADPEHVDKRRKAIGLEALKVYLKRKIDYDWKVIQKN